MKLNQDQELVLKQKGPILLIAGAGSGKTRTLVERVRFLQEEGIESNSILLITFTNKAAQEMKERLNDHEVVAKTFHGLALDALKNHCPVRTKHFTIYDQSDQLALVRQFLRTLKIVKKPKEEILLKALSEKKINQKENSVEYFEDFYQFYEQSLNYYDALDFDDLLVYGEKYIQDDFIKKFQYIMVDEFQDTNLIQMKFLMKLTKFHQEILCVGDMDQSIYAFRGAREENLKFFMDFYKPKVFFLQKNYRSHSKIIELANAVIEENKRVFPKKMISIREEEQKPVLKKFLQEEEEALWVVDYLKKYQDSVLLFRSSQQIHFVEQELVKQGIKYELIGGKKIFEKKEIKDLLAYLSFIQNPKDEISFRRIINTPLRSFGEKSLKELELLSKEKLCTLFEGLSFYRPTLYHDFLNLRKRFFTQNLSEAFEGLLQEIQWENYLQDQYKNHLKQLERKMQDLFFLKRSISLFKGNLRDYLLNLKLKEEDQVQENQVKLLSIHSAKGLEFNKVIILGVEDDYLPHKKSYLPEHYEEERRLFYVAITRAKNELVMTQCQERLFQGKVIYPKKSRYLTKLDTFYVEEKEFIFSSKEEQKQAVDNFFQDLRISID